MMISMSFKHVSHRRLFYSPVDLLRSMMEVVVSEMKSTHDMQENDLLMIKFDLVPFIEAKCIKWKWLSSSRLEGGKEV